MQEVSETTFPLSPVKVGTWRISCGSIKIRPFEQTDAHLEKNLTGSSLRIPGRSVNTELLGCAANVIVVERVVLLFELTEVPDEFAVELVRAAKRLGYPLAIIGKPGPNSYDYFKQIQAEAEVRDIRPLLPAGADGARYEVSFRRATISSP